MSGHIAHGTAEYRRLSLALLMAGFSTFGLMYDVQPLLPIFTREFGISAANASLAVSCATGAMALAFIPVGILSDRIGRRPVMVASLFASAILTILSALLAHWGSFLAVRAVIGLALSGVPAVAMAYVSEEVDSASVGAAMGLYIAGSAIGGMTGRLGVTIVSDFVGWREALMVMGLAGLVSAAAFARFAPRPVSFAPVRHDLRSLLAATARLFADRAMPWLYLEGFLLMGSFISIYNYVGFRLLAAPYSLSQSTVGAIFLLYLVGSYSSATFGGFAGRVGRRRVFWMPIVALACGIMLTAAQSLWLIVAGIAIVTAAFFAAHSTASSWVGRRTTRDRAQASALYLLFYYAGSSVLGSAGGLAWTRGGWPGVVWFGLALTAIALLIAIRLAGVRPLAESPPQRLP